MPRPHNALVINALSSFGCGRGSAASLPVSVIHRGMRYHQQSGEIARLWVPLARERSESAGGEPNLRNLREILYPPLLQMKKVP